MVRCEPYFGWGGCIIDQAFQPRLPEGMIRCYMSGKRVAGSVALDAFRIVVARNSPMERWPSGLWLRFAKSA
jgi:hypothetical protein